MASTASMFDDPLAACIHRIQTLKQRRDEELSDVQDLELERAAVVSAITLCQLELQRKDNNVTGRKGQLKAFEAAIVEMSSSLDQIMLMTQNLYMRAGLAGEEQDVDGTFDEEHLPTRSTSPPQPPPSSQALGPTHHSVARQPLMTQPTRTLQPAPQPHPQLQLQLQLQPQPQPQPSQRLPDQPTQLSPVQPPVPELEEDAATLPPGR